jgi:hypothetical protein
VLKPRLIAERVDTVYETLERPIAPVLALMERTGIRVERATLAGLSGSFAQSLARLEDEIRELKKPYDKQFADLLREGPGLGIHILTWADTPAAVDRTIDRVSMREFDNRVLFQMSANDSSNLIDSPAANKLGFHRALAFSEEQGVLEKFRPYALPGKAWLDQVAAALKNKTN